MTEARTERRLSIWKKVDECEKALERIQIIDQKVKKLVTLERLMKLKNNLNNT